MKKIALYSALLIAASPTFAQDLDQLQNLGQSEFRLLSEDLGSALSYKSLVPAESLGILGFDVGVEATSTELRNDSIARRAFDDSMSYLVVPKVHVHKGLPMGIDVGGFYASVPSSNISLTGLELRYALIDGGVAMPALGVRGTWSSLSGVDQLDMETKGVELTVSKGFAMLTPYAGLGQVWVTSTPNDVVGPSGAPLEEEDFSMNKYFLGANLNLGLLNLAVEADKTGDASTYGAKLGFRF